MKHVLLDENRSIVAIRNVRFPNSVEAPDSAVCGMIWHSKDDVRGPEPSAPVPRRVGSRYEAQKLFTTEEFAWFNEARKSNEDIDFWLFQVGFVVDFWLDHETFKPMMELAVSLGGLTQERAAEILATDFNEIASRLAASE